MMPHRFAIPQVQFQMHEEKKTNVSPPVAPLAFLSCSNINNSDIAQGTDPISK